MNSQKLSVVIPAYNEERVIANSINSLLRQSYKNFEIIIVDDGSTDKTREIVREISKKNKKVMLLTQNHEGPGNARNLGAKKSTGRILIFVDADMEFEKEFLEKISVDIRKGHVIGTKYGYEEAKNYEQNVWSRCFGKVRWNAYGFGVKEYPVFSAILKSEFDKVNGFDPSMGYADDQSLSKKLEKRAKVINTTCYHNNPSSLTEIYKQYRWSGKAFIPFFKDANNYFMNRQINKFLILVIAIILLSLAAYLFGASAVLIVILLGALLLLFYGVKKAYKERYLPLVFFYPIFLIVRYVAIVSGIALYILTKSNVK